ncbi:hypothetical protein JQX13_31240 [Archangium violaceum]|uniref:hypothetical protein n=1 Tax=Archangium violaceum TaxID=83451 RepID=UPI00193BBAF1|nr:hypothetical protein [Archangium violaceum]QRK04699.1 hypothetical protein JQX13_31240 [Archangium violaceum]
MTVDTTSNAGTVNPFSWGVGAPDKYVGHWPGNETLKQRIRDAKVKLVRVGVTQWGQYNGKDVYPAHDTWNWTTLDALLNTLWDSGAEPLIVVCGFPGGVDKTLSSTQVILSADWAEYGTFMAGLVQRYNVDKVLGAAKRVRYFEMWNLDILSWHNYGPWADSTATNAQRMAWTKPNYQDDVIKVKNGGLNGVLTGPSGKKYGAAITEYNIAQGDFAGFNAKYHSEVNATWMASAIINAMKANIDLFTFYNLAEAGENHLGLLSNTDFAPYKPYFTLFLFGNYNGRPEADHDGRNGEPRGLRQPGHGDGKHLRHRREQGYGGERV